VTDLYDRFISICLGLVLLLGCAGLMLVGIICEILGLGNIWNGGAYVPVGFAFKLVGFGAVLLSGGFFLGRDGHSYMKRR